MIKICRPNRHVRSPAPVPQSLRFCFLCILVSKILRAAPDPRKSPKLRSPRWGSWTSEQPKCSPRTLFTPSLSCLSSRHTAKLNQSLAPQLLFLRFYTLRLQKSSPGAFWPVIFHWFSKVFIGFYWFSLVSIDVAPCPRISNDLSSISVDVHWFSLLCVEFHAFANDLPILPSSIPSNLEFSKPRHKSSVPPHHKSCVLQTYDCPAKTLCSASTSTSIVYYSICICTRQFTWLRREAFPCDCHQRSSAICHQQSSSIVSASVARAVFSHGNIPPSKHPDIQVGDGGMRVAIE